MCDASSLSPLHYYSGRSTRGGKNSQYYHYRINYQIYETITTQGIDSLLVYSGINIFMNKLPAAEWPE
jgi:hypothetical protein